MEGWEEGMAMTWRGERNMLEKDVELVKTPSFRALMIIT